MKTIRRSYCLLVCIASLHAAFAQHSTQELARYIKQAAQVTIIRDNWGIPHVFGKSDADAVFGLLYAQCEDDFKRVEMNYVEKLGRLAEVNGEKDFYNDLLIRLVIDSAEAIDDYHHAPSWLKKLCDAFADGVNYFLYKHPEIKPALLNHFEPWYPLLWTDGSIGAISTAGITAKDLKEFYAGGNPGALNARKLPEEDPTGSNGFAFAPSITASHHAILYINPHVTLYFRPEVHMISEEGLNVYGAVTWGQFFVYQGFNEHCAWMHTSSEVDASDSYLEKVSSRNGKLFYEYEHALEPVIEKQIVIRYLEGGGMQSKKISAYFTRHGPVMAKKNGQWVSVRSFNRSMNGLLQSWLRTKAKNFEEFKKVLALRGNTSNNTVYADAEGNIAYWHGNFIPIRDTSFDWSEPVDGTTARTEWKGTHSIDQIIHVYNPPNGWLQNCNSTPFSVAGKYSPHKKDYPRYMAPDGENFRAINAVRILDEEKDYTIDKVIAKGYDTYLAGFEKIIPALAAAYQSLKPEDSLQALLKEPVKVLVAWDRHSGENSVATNLAVEWGQRILPSIMRIKDSEATDQPAKTAQFAAQASPAQLLYPLLDAISSMTGRWGKWDVPWGKVNRYQRISGALHEKFDDAEPSIPVGFTSSLWGQIPSYASTFFPGTEKRYGLSGNSFICAVEFGAKIRARSLLAGGESGDPASKHFGDQALMYTKGQFKEVLFYPQDIMQHAEKKYHPGE